MSDQLASLLPIVAFALIFWLLLIRPAQRRRKQVAAMQSQLNVGDEVMLSSGFFGTVHGLSDDGDSRVELELSDGVVVFVARGAISEVLTTADAEWEDDSDPDYAEDDYADEDHAEDDQAADSDSLEASEPKKPASES